MINFKQGNKLYWLILRGYTTPDILINHPRGMPINEPLYNEPSKNNDPNPATAGRRAASISPSHVRNCVSLDSQ